MPRKATAPAVSRRRFLAATGGVVAVAPAVAQGIPGRASASPADAAVQPPVIPTPPPSLQKIPIGVFDPVFYHLPLESFLDKLQALGLEAVEIATSGYPRTPHCPVQEMLEDLAKARAWKKKFDDRNIRIGAFSCHGNPVHPDARIAQRDRDAYHRTVLLAERLEVPVIVGFSGCPGDSDSARHPTWVTYRWPDDYEEVVEWQWKERVIPYWKEAAAFAR